MQDHNNPPKLDTMQSQTQKKTTATVSLPPIPEKNYFSIGEASELCAVKPHVLRYWEQEFTQLKPAKRRGNRRYYQQKDLLLIRQIRHLLYEQGFTISGARHQLQEQKEQNRQTNTSLPQTEPHSLQAIIAQLEEVAELLEA